MRISVKSNSERSKLSGSLNLENCQKPISLPSGKSKMGSSSSMYKQRQTHATETFKIAIVIPIYSEGIAAINPRTIVSPLGSLTKKCKPLKMSFV